MLKKRGKIIIKLSFSAMFIILMPNTIAFAEDKVTNVVQTTGEEVNINKQNTTVEVVNNELVNSSFADESDFTFDQSTGTITKYVGNSSDVVVPSKIGGVDVKTIGNGAFSDNRNLTSVTISEGITKIAFSAFTGSTNLKNITIPSSVTNIDNNIVHYCSSLTNINVDSNNANYKSVNGVLFNKSATELIAYPVGKEDKNYIIPEGVTSIKNYAFDRCIYLQSVTIPSSVTNLGEEVFSQCYGIVNINVDNNNQKYKSVNGILFNKLGTELIKYPIGKIEESYDIPEGVRTIKFDAFAECYKLKTIKMPSTMTTIESSAFSGCFMLQNIQIPFGVTSIGRYAFSGCGHLTSIEVPSSVTTIDEDAFYYCTELTSITIQSSVKSIGKNAFQDCSKAKIYVSDLNEKQLVVNSGVEESRVIVNSQSTISNGFEFDATTGTITKYTGNASSVVIPSTINGVSVTKIGKEAFYNNNTLKSVVIPDSITSMGDGVFKYCRSLESVTLPSKITDIGDEVFYDCESLKSVTLPSSITSIGRCAFIDCSKLTSIKIPSSVLEIENWAFWGCTSLTSVEISNGVTSIGDNAFYQCTSLNSISIPDSVISMGKNIFDSCTNLQNIKLPNNILNISQSTFRNCTNLKNVVIPNKVTSIDYGVFEGCSNLQDVIIPKGVTNIGSFTFSKCTSLKNVIIPNSVTTIGNNVFSSCTSLKSVIVSESVANIGPYPFSGCSNNDLIIWAANELIKQRLINSYVDSSKIRVGTPSTTVTVDNFEFDAGTGTITKYTGNAATVVIPNTIKGVSVKRIGNNAFQGCNIVISITIPSSVTSIGKCAFNGCNNLVTLNIPNSVTSIEEYAFATCPNLINITIPNKITKIEKSVFLGCTKMPNIIIPNSVTIIGEDAFHGCNFKSIVIPRSVTSIGRYAFSFNSATSITIPNSVTSIGEEAFYESNWLKFYVESETVKRILNNSGIYRGQVIVGSQSQNIKATGVLLNTNVLNWTVGQAGKVTATVSPVNTANKGLTWATTNSKVATVDQNGNIKAVGAGTCIITCKTIDGSNKDGACTVNVTNITKSAGVKLSANNLNWTVGQAGKVTATVSPVNTTNKGLTWTTTNSKVATVDQNGNVKAVGVGIATITCKTKDGSNKSAICKVTVTKLSIIKAKGLELNISSLSCKVGKTVKLTATVLPGNTANKGLTWTTSNNRVATIDKSGNVKAVGAGTCVLTCKTTDGSNKSVTCKVTVTK